MLKSLGMALFIMVLLSLMCVYFATIMWLLTWFLLKGNILSGVYAIILVILPLTVWIHKNRGL